MNSTAYTRCPQCKRRLVLLNSGRRNRKDFLRCTWLTCKWTAHLDDKQMDDWRKANTEGT